MKGCLKDWLLPSVMHSFICWPSKPYTEGLNMVSTLPGFQNYSWLIKRFTNPSIGPIRWHTVVVYFHHTLLHICLLTVLRQSCINTAQCTDLFGIVGMPISVVSHSTVKVQPREGFRNGAKTKAHIYRDSGISASWILLYFMPFFLKKDVCNYLKCI